MNEKVKREKEAEIPAEVDNAAIPEVCAIDRPLTSKFNFTDCKLYVPVVTYKKNMKINYLKT